MSVQHSLIEPAPPRPARVEFMAGMLAAWVFGRKKITDGQREALEAIAREALSSAAHLNPKEDGA